MTASKLASVDVCCMTSLPNRDDRRIVGEIGLNAAEEAKLFARQQLLQTVMNHFLTAAAI